MGVFWCAATVHCSATQNRACGPLNRWIMDSCQLEKAWTSMKFRSNSVSLSTIRSCIEKPLPPTCPLSKTSRTWKSPSWFPSPLWFHSVQVCRAGGNFSAGTGLISGEFEGCTSVHCFGKKGGACPVSLWKGLLGKSLIFTVAWQQVLSQTAAGLLWAYPRGDWYEPLHTFLTAHPWSSSSSSFSSSLIEELSASENQWGRVIS